MYKKIIIVCLVLVTAVVFWLLIKPWVSNPFQLSPTSLWLTPLILLCFLSAFCALAFALLEELVWRVTIFLVIGLTFLGVFGFNGYYLAAVLILFLFFLSSWSNIRSEINERTKLNIKTIVSGGLRNIVTPLFVMISFVYFLSPTVQLSAKERQLPPTVKQTIEVAVNIVAGGNLKNLPAAQQVQTKQTLIKEILRQITDLLGPYLKFLPPVLAFGLFLILQGLSFIFVWLSILISWLIFCFLKKIDFVRVEVFNIKAEKLII